MLIFDLLRMLTTTERPARASSIRPFSIAGEAKQFILRGVEEKREGKKFSILSAQMGLF